MTASNPNASKLLPIVMQIQSIPHADGEWVRRVSFPDFPSCVVETENVEEGIDNAYQLLLDHLEQFGHAEQGDRRALRTDLEPMIDIYRSLER
ncbi:MAG: hypothetical protein O3B90_07040 [Actinomycetota bacterium]|nr:hypothetical protein [Actinomycetota bacterium]